MAGTKTLYVVRHGTVHNPNRIAYRRLPGFHLGDQGRKEARETAVVLQPVPLEVIWHSPLDRTAETATFINEAHHVPMIIDPLIHEWDEGETLEEVTERMRSFYEAWMDSPYQVAAAVSHRDPIRALLHWLDGRPFEPAADTEGPYPLSPAGVFRVTDGEAGRKIEKVK